jgi:Rps23 Pro-64 3,4-dihydroxylase Tpa1-like proline 4-hydroxylase
MTEKSHRFVLLFNSCSYSYTCILYMNDNDWDVSADGGALRLYFNTQHIYNPMDVITDSSTHYDFVDVSPTNGRLLIFDSCLVHSVQPVLSPLKQRRALTLWINRLNTNGVRGEMYESKST